VAFCFSVTTVLGTTPFGFANPVPLPLITPNILLKELSPEVCAVERVWQAPSQKQDRLGEYPLVVLLQEAHMNYQAQKNIIDTLTYFQERFETLNLGREMTIGLEGNPYEKINTDLFTAFPLPEVTQEVSQAFLESSKIDGAEYFAINVNREARLHGIDDPVLYEDNDRAYQRFLPVQQKNKKILTNLLSAFNSLKSQVYSKSLKKLDESKKVLEKDINQMRVHLNLLFQLSKLKEINTEVSPAVVGMMSLFEKQDRLDERALIEEFSQSGMARDPMMEEAVWKKLVIQFWDGLNPEQQWKYPSMKQWVQLQVAMEELIASDFFGELESLETDLFTSLVRSKDEQLLVQIDPYLSQFQRMIDFALTQKNYGQLKKDLLDISNFSLWEKLDSLFQRRNIQFKSVPVINDLWGDFEHVFNFYDVALKRDLVLAENIHKLLDDSTSNVVFVVLGGFHTEGVTQRLQEKNISYLQLLPMANPDEDESLYWQKISGERQGLEKWLAEKSTRKLTSKLVRTPSTEPEFIALGMEVVTMQMSVAQEVYAAAALGEPQKAQMFIKVAEEYKRNLAGIDNFSLWNFALSKLIQDVRTQLLEVQSGRRQQIEFPVFQFNLEGVPYKIMIQRYSDSGSAWAPDNVIPNPVYLGGVQNVVVGSQNKRFRLLVHRGLKLALSVKLLQRVTNKYKSDIPRGDDYKFWRDLLESYAAHGSAQLGTDPNVNLSSIQFAHEGDPYAFYLQVFDPSTNNWGPDYATKWVPKGSEISVADIPEIILGSKRYRIMAERRPSTVALDAFASATPASAGFVLDDDSSDTGGGPAAGGLFLDSSSHPLGGPHLRELAINELGPKLNQLTQSDASIPYVITGFIAKGGMGYVFKAEEKATGRTVAVKTLQPKWLEESELKERFKREAEVLIELGNGESSYLTTEAYDYRELSIPGYQGSMPAYSMELLENAGDFGDLQKAYGGKVDMDLGIQSVALYALSLHAFHVKGVLHRDIKPANMGLKLVRPEDVSKYDPNQLITVNQGNIQGTFIPIVLDLGFAKVNSEVMGRSIDTLTQTRDVMGTPMFMAPEQRRDTKHVDARAEVYAVALSLFNMITGRYPVDFIGGETAIDYFRRVDNPNTPRNKASVLLGLQGDEAVALDAIFDRALALDKDLRYPTVKELAEDLLRYQHGDEYVEALSDNRFIPRARKWMRANKSVLMITFGLLFSLGIVLGGVGYTNYKKNQQLALAQKAETDRLARVASAKAKIVETIALYLRDQFGEARRKLQEANKELQDGDDEDTSNKIKTLMSFDDAYMLYHSETRKPQPNTEVLRGLVSSFGALERDGDIGDRAKLFRSRSAIAYVTASLATAEPDYNSSANLLVGLPNDLSGEDAQRGAEARQNLVGNMIPLRYLPTLASANLVRLLKQELPFLESGAIDLNSLPNHPLLANLNNDQRVTRLVQLAYWLGYPSSQQDANTSTSLYGNALAAINQNYQTNTIPEDILWLKAVAQAKSGQFEEARTTLSGFQSRFSSSSKSSQVVLFRAMLGNSNALQTYSTDSLEAYKASFDAVRNELRVADQFGQEGTVERLRIRSAVVQSYFLQLQDAMVRYRNILEPDYRTRLWTPEMGGHGSPELGRLYNDLLKNLAGDMEDYFKDNLQSEINSTIRRLRNARTSEDLAVLREAFDTWIFYALNTDLQMGDLGNLANRAAKQRELSGKTDDQFALIAAAFDSLGQSTKTALTAVPRFIGLVQGTKQLSEIETPTIDDRLGAFLGQRRINLTAGNANPANYSEQVQGLRTGFYEGELGPDFDTPMTFQGLVIDRLAKDGAIAQSLGAVNIRVAIEVVQAYQQALATSNPTEANRLNSLLQVIPTRPRDGNNNIQNPIYVGEYAFTVRSHVGGGMWETLYSFPGYQERDIQGSPGHVQISNGQYYQLSVEKKVVTQQAAPTPAVAQIPRTVDLRAPVTEPVEVDVVGNFIRNFNAAGNGYRIEKELARGGMGAVFKGVRSETDRDVAIKIILPGLADAETITRFNREIEVVAELDGHGIVHVVDRGTMNGINFYVMNFVYGDDLYKVVQNAGHLSVDQASEIIIELARTMQRAHNKGIIHRDLKTLNVMMHEGRIPLVMDFGLAKKLNGNPSEDGLRVALTQTGALLGTPNYMSPEQATGSDTSPQFDNWALGVILYEMLTGQQPFTGNTLFELLTNVMTQTPKKPSEIVKGIPKELEAIIFKMLEKDVSLRYKSAGEFADDVQRFVDGKRTKAAETRTKRALSRNKWKIRGGIFFGVLVVMGPLVATGMKLHSNWQKKQAEIRALAERQEKIDRAQAQLNLAIIDINHNRHSDATQKLNLARGFVEGLRDVPPVLAIINRYRTINLQLARFDTEVAKGDRASGDVLRQIHSGLNTTLDTIGIPSDVNQRTVILRAELAAFTAALSQTTPGPVSAKTHLDRLITQREHLTNQQKQEVASLIESALNSFVRSPQNIQANSNAYFPLLRSYVEGNIFSDNTLQTGWVQLWYARLLRYPTPSRNLEASQRNFVLAITNFGSFAEREVPTDVSTPAAVGARTFVLLGKERAAWLRAIAQREAGQFQTSNTSLTQFRRDYPSSSHVTDTYFIQIRNLLNLSSYTEAEEKVFELITYLGGTTGFRESLENQGLRGASLKSEIQRFVGSPESNDPQEVASATLKIRVVRMFVEVRFLRGLAVFASQRDINEARHRGAGTLNAYSSAMDRRNRLLTRARDVNLGLAFMIPMANNPNSTDELRILGAEGAFIEGLILDLSQTDESNVAERGRSARNAQNAYVNITGFVLNTGRDPVRQAFAPAFQFSRLFFQGSQLTTNPRLADLRPWNQPLITAGDLSATDADSLLQNPATPWGDATLITLGRALKRRLPFVQSGERDATVRAQFATTRDLLVVPGILGNTTGESEFRFFLRRTTHLLSQAGTGTVIAPPITGQSLGRRPDSIGQPNLNELDVDAFRGLMVQVFKTGLMNWNEPWPLSDGSTWNHQTWTEVVPEEGKRKINVSQVFVLRKIKGEWSLVFGQRGQGSGDMKGVYHPPAGSLDEPLDRQYETAEEIQEMKKLGLMDDTDFDAVNGLESTSGAAARELYEEFYVGEPDKPNPSDSRKPNDPRRIRVTAFTGRLHDAPGRLDRIMVRTLVYVDPSETLDDITNHFELTNFRAIPLQIFLNNDGPQLAAAISEHLGGAELYRNETEVTFSSLRQLLFHMQSLRSSEEPTEAQSLGAIETPAQDLEVFDFVEENKIPTVVFIDLNDSNVSLLEQLTDSERDVRQGNKKNMVVLLVQDWKAAYNYAKAFGGVNRLWKDYGVLLFDSTRSLKDLNQSRIETMLDRISRSHLFEEFPDGLRMDQAVFLGESFQSQGWGEDAIRIQIADAAAFNTNENYRSASIAASLYVANHRANLNTYLERVEGSNNYKFISNILTELVNTWKNIKRVLIAA